MSYSVMNTPLFTHSKRKHSGSDLGTLIASGKRLAQAYAHSQTKTKKKTETEETSEMINGYGSSKMSVVLNAKAPKDKLPGYSPFKFYSNTSLTTTSSYGEQGFTLLKAYNLADHYTQGNPSQPFGHFDAKTEYLNLFTLNTDDNITGSWLWGGNASNPGTPANDEIILGSIDTTFEFSNFSNVPTVCDLFVFAAKKGASTSSGGLPDSVFASACLNEQTSGNISAISRNSLGTATEGTAGSLVVGQYPTGKRLFNQMFRTLGVKKIVLGPGSTETHHLSIKVNKRIVKKVVEQQAVTGNIMANTTIFVYLLQRGVVGMDTTVSYPTYSASKVGCVQHTAYHFFPSKYKKRGPVGIMIDQVPAGGSDTVKNITQTIFDDLAPILT